MTCYSVIVLLSSMSHNNYVYTTSVLKIEKAVSFSCLTSIFTDFSPFPYGLFNIFPRLPHFSFICCDISAILTSFWQSCRPKILEGMLFVKNFSNTPLAIASVSDLTLFIVTNALGGQISMQLIDYVSEFGYSPSPISRWLIKNRGLAQKE